MQALTPAERRGALVIVLLLVIGTGWDLWRTHASRTPSRPDVPPQWPIGPAPLDSARAAVPPESSAAVQAAAARLDLNRATAHELDGLPGIGPVLAARIVAYREEHGPFRTTQELLAVRGIGPRLYARILPGIAIPAPSR